MAKPRKSLRSRKQSDIRIPFTAEEKRLVTEAATAAHSDVDAWLRPLILQAARSLLAKTMTPTNAELLKAAEQFPPPSHWFEQDEERPF